MNSHVMPAAAEIHTMRNSPLVMHSYLAQQPEKDRPAIFVLPAATQNAVPFRAVGIALAQREINVHVLSLRGHPPSGGQFLFATFSRYLDDIRSTLCAADLSRVIIVGHSTMGGCLAQELARTQECAGLVLINTCLPHHTLHYMLILIKQLAREHPFRLCLSGLRPKVLFDSPELTRKFLLGRDAPESVVQEMLKDVLCNETLLYFPELIRLSFRRRDVRPIKTDRVLAIAGGRDYFFPLTVSSAIVDFYQASGVQARQHSISEAPHNSIQTHPEMIAQIMHEFWQACL